MGFKNVLKGVGFFLGGLLLILMLFKGVMFVMVVILLVVWCFSIYVFKNDLGKVKNKFKFNEIFLKSSLINILLVVRLFLFGVCDVWFVVVLLVFLL